MLDSSELELAPVSSQAASRIFPGPIFSAAQREDCIGGLSIHEPYGLGFHCLLRLHVLALRLLCGFVGSFARLRKKSERPEAEIL
jgi:hypothetical protein